MFERYLSVWVAICMLAGVALGKFLPIVTSTLRRLELGSGSQVNAAHRGADLAHDHPHDDEGGFLARSATSVNGRAGLLVTLLVNWIVKPFSMAFLAWLFFRHVFSASGSLRPRPTSTSPAVSSSPLLPAPPWCLCGVNSPKETPAYTLVQVSVNDLIMLFLFVPIVQFLVAGASTLTVPFQVLLVSVLVFIVIPLVAGVIIRRCSSSRERARFGLNRSFCRRFAPVHHRRPCSATLVLIFAFQADNITGRFFHVVSDRHTNHAAGLLQFVAHLRSDEVVQSGVLSRCARRFDRSKQLLRASCRDGDRAVRTGERGRSGDGGRCSGGGACHAVRLRRMQPHAALVSCSE